MTAQTTTNTDPKSGSKGAPAAPPPAATAAPAKSRFTKVGLDRFMFNPNQGCTGVLQGWLLNTVQMPKIARGKGADGLPIEQDWSCYLIKTTAPCKGIDREKKLVDVPVGSEVLIPATFKLSDTFARAAVDPKRVFEVQIEAIKKLKINAGQTMWLYDMGVDMDGAKPRETFSLAAQLAATEVRALLAAPAGAEIAEETPLDTPF